MVSRQYDSGRSVLCSFRVARANGAKTGTSGLFTSSIADFETCYVQSTSTGTERAEDADGLNALETLFAKQAWVPAFKFNKKYKIFKSNRQSVRPRLI